MTTYIVASNAAHARVFAHEIGVLREIDRLEHPQSQMHTGDLRTGGKGTRSGGPSDAPQRATGNQQATSDKHAAFFASEVAEYLKDARASAQADRLMLIAEPRFLGVLRQKLDTPTRNAVIREVDKDLTKASVDQIARATELHLK
ncbi:host attachment protein [Alloalcanivorax mobilis]|uniref:host attachment protein n=1 Tax=Alloalcanivorax mobilis TaxID=2019569 RepID=UPI000B5B460A|nr:host attachment protein [Alloalcanivorax mobilis]ASK33581.1 hypothetical protein CEK62_03840 [Alcanivorax sp. N3-2A]|tara:strand:+ start:27267 stop:27701 length:435 start_codon:yes stop_codon:yes gene_type:complete